LFSTGRAVTDGINYNFYDVELGESKKLETDYQCKLSPETETVCVVSVGQITPLTVEISTGFMIVIK
jgi:hypothetical protein